MFEHTARPSRVRCWPRLLAVAAVWALAAAPAESQSVRLNEVVATQQDTDWVELFNTTNAAVTLTDWSLRDGGTGNAPYSLTGQTIAPNGFLVLQESVFKATFKLSEDDAVHLYNGSTLVDSFKWQEASKTSYGRCPEPAPSPITRWARTKENTPGATNSSGCFETWPGNAETTPADPKDTQGKNKNLSGLVFQPGSSPNATNTGILWAVRNSPATLYRLTWDGSSWSSAAGEWAKGKKLESCGCGCDPTKPTTLDPEGVTKAEWSSSGVYVSVEGAHLGVLRFDTACADPKLRATHQWDLSTSLPPVEKNKGLEAITWVPDSHLTLRGFKTSSGTSYNSNDQSLFPNHGTGLFFVGLEANGTIYAFSLDHVDGTHKLVASFPSGLTSIMGLEFDRDTGLLWAYCDNTCQNHSVVYEIELNDPASRGIFRPKPITNGLYDAANLDLQLGNFEGIAIAPECSGNRKAFFWSNDEPFDESTKAKLAKENADWVGHELMKGTIKCQLEMP